METNRDYYDYTDDTSSWSIRATKFSAIAVNTVFDRSGAYAMSGGIYSPFANRGVVYGGDLSIDTLSGKLHHRMSSQNYPTANGDCALFASGQSNGYHSIYVPESGVTPTSISGEYPSDYVYNKWWSPNSTGYTGELAQNYSTEMINGFSYKNVVLYPIFTGYNSDFSEASSGNLSNYDFANYPNITSIGYIIYLTWDKGGERYGAYKPVGDNEYRRFWIGTEYNDKAEYKWQHWEAPLGGSPSLEVNTIKDIAQRYNLKWDSYIFLGGDVNSVTTNGHAPTITDPTDTRNNPGQMMGLYSLLQEHFTENSNVSVYYVTMSKEIALKVVATCGLYFAATEDAAINATTGSGTTSNDIYLAVADSDGVYRGNYAQGADIADEPNADWGKEGDPFGWLPDNGVTGGGGGSPETDKTPLSHPAITAFGAFNRAFAMTQSSLNELQNYIWNADDSIFEALVNGLKMYGENPMNCLIDCRMYPFNILDYTSGTAGTRITLGRNQTTVTGVYLGNVTDCIIDLGSVQWGRYTDTFLDFSPYSSGELYVPYVGKFSLDATIYAGHTVSAYLIVDFMTGACECVVYRDGVATEYKSGSIGVDIPMSGTNAAQWAGAVLGGISSAASSVLGGAGNAVTGISAGKPQNAAGAGAVGAGLSIGANVLNGATGLVETFNTPLPYTHQGTATSAAGQWLPQQAYLTVYQAVNIEPPTYGHTVGYACEYTATLNTQAGFCVCANPDVSGIVGTEDEIAELISLLTSGVYL